MMDVLLEHFLRGFGIGFVLGFILATYITIKLVERGVL